MERLTNICEATSQSLDFDSFRPTHRKGKKLLAEKKRRARINSCLMRIRDIVCNGEEDKETDLDKMEKAEILEKTLEVLTRVRHDFESTRKLSSISTQKAMAVKYASGFSSCAEESIRYIQSSRLVPAEVKHQLQIHLRSIARNMESTVQQQGQGGESNAHYYVSPPQIIMPSTATTPPHHSSAIVVPPCNKDTPSNVHIPPTDSNVIYSVDIVTSSSQGEWKHSSSIPSPILSSTPISHHIDEHKPFTNLPNKSSGYEIASNFSPVEMKSGLTQDYTEIQSNNYSMTSVPTQQQFTPHYGSAFQRITPQPKSLSPRSEEPPQTYKSQSLSPSGFSSSSYSPISPVPHPVIVQTSTIQHTRTSTSDQQPIYSYHGYEPYPIYPNSFEENSVRMPKLGTSPTESSHQLQTPNKAMDLCIKRNDSHNISPETMWRPW